MGWLAFWRSRQAWEGRFAAPVSFPRARGAKRSLGDIWLRKSPRPLRSQRTAGVAHCPQLAVLTKLAMRPLVLRSGGTRKAPVAGDTPGCNRFGEPRKLAQFWHTVPFRLVIHSVRSTAKTAADSEAPDGVKSRGRRNGNLARIPTLQRKISRRRLTILISRYRVIRYGSRESQTKKSLIYRYSWCWAGSCVGSQVGSWLKLPWWLADSPPFP